MNSSKRPFAISWQATNHHAPVPEYKRIKSDFIISGRRPTYLVHLRNSKDLHLDIAERKQHRENAVQRLMVLEGVCEIDARMLVDVIGCEWSSLKREADLMKKALAAKIVL